MRLIARDYEPDTGITEEFWFSEEKQTITIRRLQDVDPILAMNRNEFNMFAGKKPTFNDVNGIYKAATIPNILIEKWKKEGFDWFKATEKEKAARLNSIDYRHLKTRPGKI